MQLPVIRIERIKHRGGIKLFLFFSYNEALIRGVKSIPGSRWSETHRAWYIPEEKGSLEQLQEVFSKKAWLDYTSLRHQGSYSGKPLVIKRGSATIKYRKGLTPKARGQIDKLADKLISLGYAEHTIEVYRSVLEIFLGYLKKDASQLDMDDVISFQVEHFSEGKYSASTQRQFIAALKHLLAVVPSLNIEPEVLVLPKKEEHLPRVLSQEEIMLILGVIKNMKHFLMLSLMYSSGLRVGELLNLRIEDISLERKQIHIRQSKGKKDRYVGISTFLIPAIRQYIRKYHPEVYLFNGQKGLQYTASSVRKVLQRAVKDAGLGKRVTPHMLRHSYATHLLEGGVDIRYIQELLGHNKPETTMIYTHITTKQLTDIKSPLDALVEKFRDKGNGDNKKFLLSGK